MPLKYANNQSLTATTALPASVPTDNLILISTQTASSSATISFTTGLDSTYDEYIFKFINVAPATNEVVLQFNFSTDSGSNYNVTKTSTSFTAYHNEGDTATGLDYDTGQDLAQSTGYQPLGYNSGNNSSLNYAGDLQLFNPSSTTYVKHFISKIQHTRNNGYFYNYYTAGYGNTTSAINAIRFQFSSGNIASGIFKLYGVKKS